MRRGTRRLYISRWADKDTGSSRYRVYVNQPAALHHARAKAKDGVRNGGLATTSVTCLHENGSAVTIYTFQAHLKDGVMNLTSQCPSEPQDGQELSDWLEFQGEWTARHGPLPKNVRLQTSHDQHDKR